MLILSRRVGEEIVIDGNVRVRVTKVHGKRVRLAVEAPDSVSIHRGEVRQQFTGFKGIDNSLDSAEALGGPLDLQLERCLQ